MTHTLIQELADFGVEGRFERVTAAKKSSR